jgi:hypothetical protein
MRTDQLTFPEFLGLPEYMLDSPPVSRAGEPPLPAQAHGLPGAGPARRFVAASAISGSANALSSLPGAHPYRLGCGCSWCFITARLTANQRRSRKQGRAKS